MEVLEWMSEGKSNWEIGKILTCAEETVKKHLQRVYKKLEVSNRVSAANWLRTFRTSLGGAGHGEWSGAPA